MKKSLQIITLLSVVLSIALFSCKPNSSKDKYKDLPKELAELCRKIDKNPKDADLYEQRSTYYIQHKLLDSAFTDAVQSLKLDSGNSKRYTFLSDLYFMKGEFESCEDLLERALVKNDKDVEAMMKLAELNLYYKRYTEMNGFIDQALMIDQRNPKAHLLRGFGFIEQKDTISAVREYQLAVDQDPKYYEAYIQLGLVFHRKHNPLALDYYNNALNVRPQSTEAMYNIAMFYQDIKKYDKALDEYRMILQVDPKHTNANHNIGWINLEIKQNYTEAEKYFTLSINSDTMSLNAIYNRGLTYERMKKLDNAMADYHRALRLNPSFELASDGVKRLKKVGIKD